LSTKWTRERGGEREGGGREKERERTVISLYRFSYFISLEKLIRKLLAENGHVIYNNANNVSHWIIIIVLY